MIEKTQYTVDSEQATLRECPSYYSPIMFTFAKDRQVDVLGFVDGFDNRSERWAAVTWLKRTGYVIADKLVEVKK